MKNSFVIFFVFFSAYSLAQTHETNFLKKKEVTWAGFISDTVKFASPNLSLVIRRQVDAGKIKTAVPNIDKHIYIDQKVSLEYLRNGGTILEVPVYDSLGNPVTDKNIHLPNELFSSDAFDISNNDLLYAEQFLLLDKNRLRSHVSWVSPAKKIVTSKGVYLGESYIFNAYHNTSENISRRVRRKAIPLGTTSKIFTDSSFNGEMIKQWFGETFAKALWHTLSSGEVEIYRIDSAKRISFADIKDELINNIQIHVPAEDMLGKLFSVAATHPPLDPAVFTQFSIIQQWYYNAKKEVVFNDVKEVILYAKKLKGVERESEPSPILRIVYK